MEDIIIFKASEFFDKMGKRADLNEVGEGDLRKALAKKTGEKFMAERNRYVAEVDERVKTNVGNAVVVYRRIVIEEDEGGFFGHGQTEDTHLEVGIIRGDLIVNEGATFEESLEHAIGEYYYGRDLLIPVKRRLVAGGLFQAKLENDFLDSIEDRGEIGFGLTEVDTLRKLVAEANASDPLLGVQLTQSCLYLSHFELGIGDKEVGGIVEMNCLMPASIREQNLVRLLKSGDLSEKITGYRDNRGVTLRNELASRFYRLIGLGAEFENIRREVMSLDLVPYGGDKGDRPDYGWGDKKLHDKYIGLKENIGQVAEQVKRLTDDKKAVALMSRGKFDGAEIGFPIKVGSEDYIRNVGGVIARYERAFEEVDRYLTESRGKKGRR